VILKEGSKKSCVSACGLHLVDTIDEVTDATTGRLECLCDPKVAEALVSNNYSPVGTELTQDSSEVHS